MAGSLQAACQEHREGMHHEEETSEQAFHKRMETAGLRAVRLLARMKGYPHGVDKSWRTSELSRICEEPNIIPADLSPAELRAACCS